MRIIHTNAVDSYSTITATNPANSTTMPIANVTKEGKTRVYRTSGTTTLITVAWTSDQRLNGVAIPWGNFSSSATIAIVYKNSAGTIVYNSGTLSGTSYIWPMQTVLGTPSNANSFIYSGYGTALVWTTLRSDVRSMEITLNDTGRANIEIARIVAGEYWQPTVQPSVGAAIAVEDLSRVERAESGDARIFRGPRLRKMRLELSMMKQSDRDTLWSIIRKNGQTYPMFVQVLSSGQTSADEIQMLQMYCKYAASPSLTHQFYNSYQTQLELEEM